MPILYIHGVNTRNREGFFALKPFLERLVAPVIANDPDKVLIDDVYWGDVGVKFAWDGAARPRSRLLGMGADDLTPELRENVFNAYEFSKQLKTLPVEPIKPSSSGLTSGRADNAHHKASIPSLDKLDETALSDLFVSILIENVKNPEARAKLALLADEVAMKVVQEGTLAQADSPDKQIDLLLEELNARMRAQDDKQLVGMGAPAWVSGAYDRLRETFNRAVDLPTYTISVVTAEIRPPLNKAVSLFLGDAFEYLRRRGDKTKPGMIPLRLLDKLKLARDNAEARKEPLIVLSHSMGGQIVYDAITHFMPGIDELKDLRIDFWCATASQVGFFEEAKFFLASENKYHEGNPVPFPSHNLKAWWNVWDYNDFLSFTVKDIIADVDDEPYDSGMSILAAHGGYLERPSFYRKLAAKVRQAVT